MKQYIYILSIVLLAFSCSTDDAPSPSSHPMLHITFVMDTSVARLDNLGNPVSIPNTNAAQHPDFEILGLHFIGLFEDQFSAYENGVTVFSSPTTEAGGSMAIDFEKEAFLSPTNNELSFPLNEISPGSYEYFRTSIGYQKYKITYNLAGAASNNPNWPNGISDDIDIEATLASFLGFNTYIDHYTIDQQSISVNANKLQGYFGLESNGTIAGFQFNDITEGDAAQTTVPNPISASSPIPAGSCVVTGQFPTALVIPETPTEDIHIQITVSINNSFEWQDDNQNGKYEPLLGEDVVDMGIRGIFPSVL